MTALIRHAAIAVTLLAGIGAAHAQTVITTQPGTTGIAVAPAPLALTPTQRTTVYRTLSHGRVVSERIVTERTEPVAPRVVVGARVPAGMQLAPIPDDVVTEVPAMRPYRYMTIDDRVWLVDPTTSTVVEELGE